MWITFSPLRLIGLKRKPPLSRSRKWWFLLNLSCSTMFYLRPSTYHFAQSRSLSPSYPKRFLPALQWFHYYQILIRNNHLIYQINNITNVIESLILIFMIKYSEYFKYPELLTLILIKCDNFVKLLVFSTLRHFFHVQLYTMKKHQKFC